MAWREDKWTEMYYHCDLRKAANHLGKDLADDLLSDSLIKVFEKSDSELLKIQKWKEYVFMVMRNLAYSKSWWAKYETESVEYDVSIKEEPNEETNIEVTQNEAQEAVNIFGFANEQSVLLMRNLDIADASKLTDYKLWRGGQYVKLYIDPELGGSLRKVQERTGIGYRQISTGIKDFTRTLMAEKVKVTYVTYGSEVRSGMELYRLHYPYAQGIATYHGIQYEVDQTTYAAISEMPILESDIYVFSRIRFPEIVDKVLSQNKKLVIDIDDYWKLHKDHPILKAEQSRAENTEYVTNVTGALKRAHLVTTTTQILADKIKEELGVEATVIKNSIPDHSQFDGEKLPHNKVRVGYVGGNHHSPDLAPMQEGMKKLNSDPALVGRYQVVLGGFNTFRATDGNVYANPHFVDYEKILSSDFRALRADTEYIDYLKMCTPMLDHIGYDKAYRRIWNKPLTSYGQMYRQLDVAFAPLIDNTFNACKSELKLIEAGRSRTALIASDVDPYKNHLEHEVNCLAVSPTRHDWYTQVRRMINDKDLREEVADNLHEYVNKNFDHKRETQKLANALSKLK